MANPALTNPALAIHRKSSDNNAAGIPEPRSSPVGQRMNQPSPSSRLPQWVWLTGCTVLVLWWAFGLESQGNAALNSLWLGLGAAAIGIPAGLMIWKSGLGSGFRPVVIVLLTVVVSSLPPWIHVCAWDAVFGKLGWLTSLTTQRLALIVPPWFAAIWIHAMIGASQVAIILHLYQSGSGWALEERASLDVSPSTVFWRVTFPRISPALLAGFVWIVATCCREIAVTDIYQIGTLAEQVYLGYAMNLGDAPGSLLPESLAGREIPLFLLTLAWLAGGAVLVAGRWQRMFAGGTTVRLHSWNGLRRSSLASASAAFLFLGTPFVNLIVRCGMRTVATDSGPHAVWRPGALVEALTSSFADSLPEWKWSLLIALAGATGSLVVAIPLVGFALRTGVGRAAVWISVLIAGCTPGPVTGRMLVWCSEWSSGRGWVNLWDRTILGPVLASGIFLWPLTAVAVWMVVRSTPARLYEMSSMDGRGSVSGFLSITVGSNLAAFLGIWFLLFALFFGELSASHLVRPSGIDILPRLALGKMHAGIDEMTAAIGLSSSLFMAVLAIAGWKLFRVWTRRRHDAEA